MQVANHYNDELRNEVREFKNEVRQGFEEMRKGFKRVDERFEQVDKRFEQVDKRFEQVDKRFEQVDKRFEQVDGKMAVLQKQVEFFGSQLIEETAKLRKDMEAVERVAQRSCVLLEKVESDMKQVAEGVIESNVLKNMVFNHENRIFDLEWKTEMCQKSLKAVK